MFPANAAISTANAHNATLATTSSSPSSPSVPIVQHSPQQHPPPQHCTYRHSSFQHRQPFTPAEPILINSPPAATRLIPEAIPDLDSGAIHPGPSAIEPPAGPVGSDPQQYLPWTPDDSHQAPRLMRKRSRADLADSSSAPMNWRTHHGGGSGTTVISRDRLLATTASSLSNSGAFASASMATGIVDPPPSWQHQPIDLPPASSVASSPHKRVLREGLTPSPPFWDNARSTAAYPNTMAPTVVSNNASPLPFTTPPATQTDHHAGLSLVLKPSWSSPTQPKVHTMTNTTVRSASPLHASPSPLTSAPPPAVATAAVPVPHFRSRYLQSYEDAQRLGASGAQTPLSSSGRRQVDPMSIASLIDPSPDNPIRVNRDLTASGSASFSLQGNLRKGDNDTEGGGVTSAVLDAAHALSAASVSDHSTRHHQATHKMVDQQSITERNQEQNARERSRKRQEYATATVSAQAGQLLQRTRHIVRQILDLCLSDAGVADNQNLASTALAADTYPGLERVLVDLFNAILTSHTDLAAREVSSQKQPLVAPRPAYIHSLDQLRVLLYGHADGRSGIESLDSITPDSNRPGMALPVEREIYMSTLEFLGLMTAFVSVVCWLMDTLVQCGLHQAGWNPDNIGSASTFIPVTVTPPPYHVDQDTFHVEGVESGADTHRQNREQPFNTLPQAPAVPKNLLTFLNVLANRDNFLRPICETLATRAESSRSLALGTTNSTPFIEPGSTPTVGDYTGLLAWHFHLFASQGLEQMGREMVDESLVGQIQFDVVLNDLYSTHVLAMSAKEHQKDHGQFYTPPAVVDFMWKRSLQGRGQNGNLLATFRAFLDAESEGKKAMTPMWYQQQPQSDWSRPIDGTSTNTPSISSTPLSLIPSVLDPCLGVSTFLSYYIREVIWQAQQDIRLWNCEHALDLLMTQICQHCWGVELDGFAFWIARCGVIAALVPLVQRIQVLHVWSYNRHVAELSRKGVASSASASMSSSSQFNYRYGSQFPRLHLFRSDTLQLPLPPVAAPEQEDNLWERDCIRKLRDPALLRVAYIVTNPPYMIRKTGTFSMPDPEVYDMSILGGSSSGGGSSNGPTGNRGRASSRASVSSVSSTTGRPAAKRGSTHSNRDDGQQQQREGQLSGTTTFEMYVFEEQQRSSSPTPELTIFPTEEDEQQQGTTLSSITANSDSHSTHPGVRRFSRQHPSGSSSRDLSSSPSRSRQSTPQQQLQQQPSQLSSPSSITTVGSWTSSSSKVSMRGMMQAYGYFIWFAMQRVVPQDGIVCMITASQWLTLEFATNLRAWLFDNSFVDEFFQFEPYKVFARVQTDSLIFKLRSNLNAATTFEHQHDDSMTMQSMQGHPSQTLFLRHLDNRASLKSTLDDYSLFAEHLLSTSSHRSSLSSKGPTSATKAAGEERQLSPTPDDRIIDELSSKITYALKSHTLLKSQIRAPTFSFAPMMPSTALSDYLFSLTAHLGGLCTAGTKRRSAASKDRQQIQHSSPSVAEPPLLWHRGPNTNPVYGLVVRMDYALSTFGERVARKWFRPALYWNGKNAPDGIAMDQESPSSTAVAPTVTTTAMAPTPLLSLNTLGGSEGAGVGTDNVNITSSSFSMLCPNGNAASETISTPVPIAAPLAPSPSEATSTPTTVTTGASIASSSSSAASTPRPPLPAMPPGLHREGQFWFYRDRHRLSRKEGSPAESYVVPKPESERAYALCMVDKEAIKTLRKEVEDGAEGAKALWQYLADVRNHFQPGLVTKRATTASDGASASCRVDEEGIAFCSTSQCGADIPSKIIHPINYGYFSKSQPRQRFFLDTSSTAVTNQCIYLTLNNISNTGNQADLPPLLYFLTLLNMSILQYFILHHCQYDQQGRMRLFRESMAKIPYQADSSPERVQYAIQLGEHMVHLKKTLYRAVSRLQLNQLGVLEWIRRGGEPSMAVVNSIRDHLRARNEQGRLVEGRLSKGMSTDASNITSKRLVRLLSPDMDVDSTYIQHSSPAAEGTTVAMLNSHEIERLLTVLTRAVGTVDLLQWAIDQYGYMLYGIGSRYQLLLEEELKIAYSSHVVVGANSPPSAMAAMTLPKEEEEELSGPPLLLPPNNISSSHATTINDNNSLTTTMAIDSTEHHSSPSLTSTNPPHHRSYNYINHHRHHRQLSSELYRWDADLSQSKRSGIPLYAAHILEEASLVTRELLDVL